MRIFPLVLAFSAACSGQYDVVTAFESPDTRTLTERVQVAVVSDCSLVDFDGPLAASIRSVEFGVDEGALPLGELPVGNYGLYARAWNESCEIVAAGCLPFRAEAGGEGLLRVEMRDRMGALCAPVERCEEARCTGGPGPDGGMDGGVFDAGRDASVDTGVPGEDVGPVECIDGAECAAGRGICHRGMCCEGCVDGDVCRAGEAPGLCEGPPPPTNMFFVGNSFTFGGPIPTMVRDLAVSAGFAEPVAEFRAVGGQSLSFHRMDMSADSAVTSVDEGWDVVVLQDFSTRPTVSAGDPMAFKEDALWFHDRALAANPDCRVVLFETWARHPDHSLYPGTFLDAADMQGQIRAAYFDAAENFIPMNTTLVPQVEVSPIGDAWELHLGGVGAIRLHGADDYHAGAAGRYLTALVAYATIYRTSTEGLVAIGVSDEDAALLQRSADSTTGFTRLPPIANPTPIPIGDPVLVDFGPRVAEGWNYAPPVNRRTGPLVTEGGSATSLFVTTADFSGEQENGSRANDFGWPEDVSRDTLWVGSFEGHAAAAMLTGRATISGLADGEYQVELFASRNDDDAGAGRLMRYEVSGDIREYDAENNTSRFVVYENLRPSDGSIDIDVSVSPNGTARFAYIGALVLTRTGD